MTKEGEWLKMDRKQFISICLMGLLLLSGCRSMLSEVDLLTPNAATSEYFITEGAGFDLDTRDNSVRYSLNLTIRKKLDNGVFLEVYFENPADKNSPIVLTKNIYPDAKEIAITSPKIYGLKSYHNYEVIVNIYTDASKKELLGRHRQLVQSLLNSKLLGNNNVVEPWIFTFDERVWEIGHQQDARDQRIIEYVLKGESVESWSELVTSLTTGLPEGVTIDDYLEQIKSGLSQDCPSLEWDIVKRDTNSAILEWRHKGCHSFPPQDNILRVDKIRNNIYTLSYVMKIDKLSDDKRERWLAIIESATLK